MQTGITKAVIEIITAALSRKGFEILEPDVAKVASPVLRWPGSGNGLWLLDKLLRTVLRKGRASNLSSLFNIFIIFLYLIYTIACKLYKNYRKVFQPIAPKIITMDLKFTMKTMLVTALILASVLAGGCLREYDTTSLAINKVDISADVVYDDTARLNIITYVSNSGKTSGEVEIQAKAYNLGTNLLMADEKISMGNIGKDRTRNGTVELEVPITGNYRIEVTLYEDGGQITSGTATISGLESLLTSPKHSYINIRDVDVTMLSRGDTTTILKVTTFLDNYGRSDSSPLTALVKLRDAKTNLIGQSGNINVGIVKADTTVVKDIELEVPKDRDYRVEVMIFENDRIITEYGISFFMAPDSQGDEDVVTKTRSVSTTETITTEFVVPESAPRPYDDVYRTGDYGAPMAEGPGILGAIVGLMAVAVIMGRRKNKVR